LVFGVGGGVETSNKQRYISALESVLTAAESHIKPCFAIILSGIYWFNLMNVE
jgi:hypothetical protein